MLTISKIKYHYLLLFVLLISSLNKLNAQIHTQQFANTDPTGWTTVSSASATNWTMTNSGGTVGLCGSTNTYRAYLSALETNDDYVITQGFSLTAGYSYSITLSHQYTKTFDIYVGTAQTAAAMLAGTNILSTTANPTSCADVSTTTSFVPTSSGTYYFGFRVQGNTGAARLDNIRIYETAPVTITWDGSSSTTWSTAANWDLNRAPNSSDIIVIPSGLSNYPATITAGSYNSLSINSSSAGTISIGASTFSGNVTINSANAGNTVEFAGTTTIGGNLTVGASGSNFNFSVNGTTTVTGTFTLGAASTAVTTNLNYPITATGAFTMGNNSSHVTNIAYTNSTTDAIIASNTGSFTFYGTVNYNASSGVQRVMKPTYQGPIVASNGGSRFMNGDLDINNNLTISGGNWFCGNSIDQSPTGALGTDANVRLSNSPYKGSGKSGRWQGLFLASDLGAVGANDLITSLSFYITTKFSDRAYNNFTIKAKLVNYSSFTQSGLDWPFKTDVMTTVFTAKDVTTSGAAWNTHVFDTPLTWDGTSNILIEITFNNLAAAGGSGFAPDGTSDDPVAYFAGAWADNIIVQTSAANTDITATANGTNSNYKNYSIFNIANGPFNINITNNWLNSGGNFYHLKNTVTFDGSSNQPVTTNGDYFYNFVVNNTSGTTALTLADDCNIEGTGTLTDGVVTTGTNKLISFSTTAANLTGYSSASYVYGNLRRYITSNTSTYGFPLGKGTSTSTYFLSEVINNSLTGVTYLDGKFVSGTPAEYSQANFTALGKQITGAGITTKTLYTLDGQGYTQLDPNSQPGGGNYSIKLYNTNYTLADWTDNGQCIMKRTSGSVTLNDYNMAGTINADNGLGRMVADGYLLSTGLTSFSEFIPALEDATPLPIKLLSFEAIKNNKRVQLNWSTGSETNNDYFTIERSVNGNDFSTILTKKGSGTTSHTIHYKAYDNSPLKGLSYYRLKQTDIDGKYTFSPIRSVKFEGIDQQTFDVYPNPVVDNRFKVNFTSNSEESILITIYNTIGQKMYQEEIKVYKGINEIPLQLENQAAGTYLVELWNERIGFIQKNIQF